MAGINFKAWLGLNKTEFDKGLKDASKNVEGFGTKLKGLAVAVGAAFGVREVLRFGAEVVKLGAKAQGVISAFERLNSPHLLNNLRVATKNTVADIDLMSAAVRAKNFHIALDQLPKYFQFATQRARETGESVDYLVESIIMGIGRKSPMILDNLGISITDIREEFEKTGDYAAAVGNIIERDLGGSAETTANSIEQLGTAWKNLMLQLSQSGAAQGAAKLIGNIAAEIQIRSDKSLTHKQKSALVWASRSNNNAYNEFLQKQDQLRGATGYNPAANAAMQLGISTGFNMTAGLGSSSSMPAIAAEEIAKVDDIVKRTSLDAEQMWNSLVGFGLQGKAGTLGALEGVLPDPTALATVRGAIVEVGEAAASTAETVGSISMAMSGLVETIASASEDGAISFAESMNIIAQAALTTISIVAALAAAELFGKEVSTKGLIGVLTAVAGIATIIGTIAAVKNTKFAEGGIVYGPTNALIGEYAGASSNPEVVAPLDKLKSIMGGSNVSEIKVVGVIRGSDIVLSNARGGNSIYGNT